MAYSAYDIARQIQQMSQYHVIPVFSFVELPKDVLSALLWLRAEWRNVGEMEHLIKMGADPRENDEGYTVLERFLEGHDGYWLDAERVLEVEVGVKMLARYGVTHSDVLHSATLNRCNELIRASEYLCTFFKVPFPSVKVHYHLPGTIKLEPIAKTYNTVDEAVADLKCLTKHDQYVAVIEDHGDVTRYLVTKNAGPLALIPMERAPGWSEQQNMVSNIVNFVMGRFENPTLPCEEDDD
jgi:hypothetical protein